MCLDVCSKRESESRARGERERERLLCKKETKITGETEVARQQKANEVWKREAADSERSSDDDSGEDSGAHEASGRLIVNRLEDLDAVELIFFKKKCTHSIRTELAAV